MLHSQIISWYLKNQRDLPWRQTRDPYRIWISEIMLQQTRVATAIDYYHRFLERFPDLYALADAEEQEVLKLWQGLGYYSRARNLHQAARDICNIYKGQFPNTYKELLNLKGIGSYTAAAIAAFAFDQPEAAVDGNVYRVLSRIFGDDTPIDTGTGKKRFHQLALEIMDKADPATFNQAIIEFGALQCLPRNPLCEDCPLQAQCFAFANNCTADFPIKSKGTKIRDRYFHYLFLYHGDSFYLEKRTGKDIWTNMYQYPLIESEHKLSPEELMKTVEWQQLLGNADLKIRKIQEQGIHKLSHQNLHMVFYNIELGKEEFNRIKKYTKVHSHEIDQFPLPKPIEKHLSETISIK